MNREIKFRLRQDNRITGYEKWYYGEKITDDKTTSAKAQWLYSLEGTYWNPKQIVHNKKDRYIGLKDKNEVEIYEGDIVEHKNPTKFGLVMFGDYHNSLGNYYGWYIQRILKIGIPKKESIKDFIVYSVIGNIYENPELLTPPTK